MTNGEKLVKTFPDIELYKKMHGGIQIDFDSTWWNAEYKEPTTKNNLGVDAISRDEVCRYVAEFVNHEFSTREEEELIDNIITGIEHMPPATPQEPRSEWEQDHEILKAYSDGANEMLDNIRAEIEAKCCITVGRENDGAITLHDVFEILDKYKAETEESDDTDGNDD